MTTVKFLSDSNGLYGFELRGHSSESCADSEGKLVCAAVSSAAYMAANTVSDVVGDVCDAEVNDAFMRVEVRDASETSKAVLEGFALHIRELSVQYRKKIKIITEV